MGNKTISTIGSITKVEMLQGLKTNILENTFVLESSKPYPGYHGKNLPGTIKPHHIFLVTKEWYSYEDISRVSQSIKRNSSLEFGARPAEIFIFNSSYPAIRIKDLESFDRIPDMQTWFNDEGIFFRKRKKYYSQGVINVKKHFELEEIDEGIYRNLEDETMFYFNIPDLLPWKVFEKMTIQIRNNFDSSNFDAALGVIYMKEHQDIVRIYEKEPKLEFIKKLKAAYLEEIRKLDL